jgi:hypothetical protein
VLDDLGSALREVLDQRARDTVEVGGAFADRSPRGTEAPVLSLGTTRADDFLFCSTSAEAPSRN